MMVYIAPVNQQTITMQQICTQSAYFTHTRIIMAMLCHTSESLSDEVSASRWPTAVACVAV